MFLILLVVIAVILILSSLILFQTTYNQYQYRKNLQQSHLELIQLRLSASLRLSRSRQDLRRRD